MKVRIKRELLLADIEDIASSAPRLVLALVQREPVIFLSRLEGVTISENGIDHSM